MGGTNDQHNIVELTIEQHAEAHRILYEQYGHWQDYVAWQGLINLDAKFDAAKQSMIEGGRKGAKTMIKQRKGKTWEEIYGTEKAAQYKKNLSSNRKGSAKTWNGKQYEITHPDGTIEKVEGLRQWCLINGHNPNTFGNACLRGCITKDGFRISLLDNKN